MESVFYREANLPTKHTLLAFLLLLILRYLIRRYWNGLSSIPGPFWASISRLWRMKEVYNGKMWLVEEELHRKYGQFFSVAILVSMIFFQLTARPNRSYWSE